MAGARSIADPYPFMTLRRAWATQVYLPGLDDPQRFFNRMRADDRAAAAMAAEGP